MEQFKHAIVYGQSVKHQPQRVGLSHELADEDISMWVITQDNYNLLTIDSNDHKTMRSKPEQRKHAAQRRPHPG